MRVDHVSTAKFDDFCARGDGDDGVGVFCHSLLDASC